MNPMSGENGGTAPGGGGGGKTQVTTRLVKKVAEGKRNL